MRATAFMAFAVTFAAMGCFNRLLAAEITFTGADAENPAELTVAANWSGGALPGEGDVAVIPVGGAAKTLTLANDWKVSGLKFTSPSAMLTIDAAAGATPKLQVGAGGLTVADGKSKTNGLTLKVVVETLADQTWDLGRQALATYQRFDGSSTLGIVNAYTVDHYAAPEYNGTIEYNLANINFDQTVYLRAKGKWANVVDTTGGYFTIGVAVPDGEKWDWGDVFPAGTQFGKTEVWMVTPTPLFGGSSASEMTFTADNISTYAIRGNTSVHIGPGVLNQLGGTFVCGNSARWRGSATYRLMDGTFNGSTVGIVSIAGEDCDQTDADQILDQQGGEANTYGLMIGGMFGNWEKVKGGFGQYILGGGTLTAKESGGWNSFGGGMVLAAKAHTRGNQSCAPGVFTQTGGVANVDFVRFGVESDNNYANTVGFGLLDIAGGRFNLGAKDFLLGKTWNRDTAAASYESNACYRVRLSGGTFAPAAQAVQVQMDIVAGDTPATVEPQRDTIFQGPVWGEGTLRKTGAYSLTLLDVSRFTGSLEVDEGVLDLAIDVDDPDEATCIKWTGDGAAAHYADGQDVTEWRETNNDGQRKAVRYVAAEGKYQPTYPTLEANAFGTHAGVKFNRSALEIPTAQNPVVGQTNWTVVVVFKAVKDASALGCGMDNDYLWLYTNSMLGNTSSGWRDNSWGISLGASPVSGSVVYGVGYANQGTAYPYAPIQSQRGNVLDGRTHVVVCTQTDVETVGVNLDGIYSCRTGTGEAGGSYARRSSPCYIGFHTSDAQGRTTADEFAKASFTGTFAEIRFYPGRVLSVAEQNALVRALSVKYGAGAAATTGDLPEAALAFDADSVTGEDGAAVETWTAGGKDAVVATSDLGGGQGAPTLVKGGFVGHNALRFTAADKTALGIDKEQIPWYGRKSFAAAVVFRTKTDGLDSNHGTYSNPAEGRGLLSTSGPQKRSVNGMSLAFRKRGTVSGYYQTVEGNSDSYRPQLIFTRKPCFLNDGVVHTAVLAYDEAAGQLRMMVDGYYASSAYAATADQDSSENLLIGSLNKTLDRYFDGEIAEVKLFDRGLTRKEMQALTDDWAAKYKFRPLTGKLFEGVGDLTETGCAAANLKVAEGATLRLPEKGLTLGTGRAITVEGRVSGLCALGDGATLRVPYGKVVEIEKLQARGRIRLDITGLDENRRPWTPLANVGTCDVEGAEWEVVGGSSNDSVVLRNGQLWLHTQKGLIFLIR